MSFTRNPGHWLRKLSPSEWVHAALAELRRAEASFRANNLTAGVAGCKRAAGMALNGALLVEPNESWDRSYMDHVAALGRDTAVPARVRDACERLLEARAPNSELLHLRSRRSDERLIEAARDIMAHAYAVVKRHESEGE